MEYKTCNDFGCDAILQDIYAKDTPIAPAAPADPTAAAPNLHLFHALRRLGWRVLGLSPDGTIGTSAQHDRMLAVAVGHGALLSTAVTTRIAREVLELKPAETDELALALVRHQSMSASRIHSIANNLRRALPPPRRGAPR